jgi:putative endonuclease
MTEWTVYIIRCRDQSLYTGITTDLARRFAEHTGSGRGAKALRGKAPLRLAWSRKAASRSEASRMEHWIKRMSKEQKEELVCSEAHEETVPGRFRSST